MTSQVIPVDTRDASLKSRAKSHSGLCYLRDYFRATNGSMQTRMENDSKYSILAGPQLRPQERATYHFLLTIAASIEVAPLKFYYVFPRMAPNLAESHYAQICDMILSERPIVLLTIKCRAGSAS